MGKIISRVIRRFRIISVRGSSTRGWVTGLKGMVEAHQAGYDLIIVPDGPRGPRYQAKPGVLQLARATGAPVYPVTYGAAWKTTVGSWDRLLIPLSVQQNCVHRRTADPRPGRCLGRVDGNKAPGVGRPPAADHRPG